MDSSQPPQRPPGIASLILGIALIVIGATFSYIAIAERRNMPYTLGPIAVGLGIINVLRYRKGRKI